MSSSTVYGTTGRRRATTDETVVVLAGEQGPAGVSYGFNWGGDWDSSVTYSEDDAVRASDGYLWICIASNSTGIDPTDPGQPDWQRLVGDITAEAISVVPVGDILAENVQDALEELDSEMTDHIASAEPVHNNYQRKMGFQLDGDGEYGCTLSYDPATRKITLTPTPSASFEYWIDGTKYVNIDALESVAHADVAGGYFFYFDETGQLVVSTTAWDLRKVAPVCYVYYLGSGVGVAYNERHTTLRDTAIHEALHFSVGTFIRGNTGFELSNYALTTDSEAAITPDVAAGDIMDEDIKHEIPAFVAADGYSIAYKSGPSANEIAIQTGVVRPYLHDGGENYIQYNQYTGGAWQLTSAGNSAFVIYTLFILPALNDSYRRLWVPGEAAYGSLALAQAALGTMPDVGTPISQEIVAAYQVIFQTNSSYATAGRARIAQVLRIKTTRAQAAAAAVSVHNSMTGRSDPDTHPASAITNTPSGTVAATTVQAAIDEIASEYGTADGLRVLKAGDTMTGPLLLPDGTAASPSLQVGVASTGFYRLANGQTGISSGGIERIRILNGGAAGEVWIPHDIATLSMGAYQDLRVERDAAGVLAIRNGANTQALRIYNTYTDASNYERAGLRWSSNQLVIGTEYLGSGTPRHIRISPASGGLYIDSNVAPGSDGYHSFGAPTLRWAYAWYGGVAASTPISIKLHASQTADAIQILSSADAVLAKIDKDGKATFANQDAASGFAMLDAGQKVAVARLGSGTAAATSVLHGDQTYKYVSRMIRTGGNVPSPVASKNWHVFYAPVAMTIDTIRAIHVGGTNCTVNVRKNGSSALRSGDYTTTTSWASFGTLQNNTLAAGDYLEIQIVTVTGSVEQVAIQIEGTPTA